MSTPPPMMGQMPQPNTGQAPVFGQGNPMPTPDPTGFNDIPQVDGQHPDQDPMEAQQPQDKLRSLMTEVNIAEKLEDDKLNKISNRVSKGFDDDLQSRKHWERGVDQWTKLAIQTIEEKSYPWPQASNVKYPLLSTAALQFGARAYPTLVPSDGQVVKTQVIGKDPGGVKAEKASRVSKFMSWQLIEDMDGWEEEMDKMLIMLAVVGTMFKKTYWDSTTEKNCSKLIYPKNFVVNYWTRCLETTERVSEIILMSPRLLKEKQLNGVYRDIDLGKATLPEEQEMISTEALMQPVNDETTPYTIIEQHTYLDLDEDGYEEPYVVTFHKESRKILRIAARFDEKSIKQDKKGKIISIKAIQYYTKFPFIPNPDGSFYDLGFGALLGPINEAVNSGINQTIDAGTLCNTQGGFIGKGLRLKMGEQRFYQGEWKAVNATGDDLRKQIVPIPAKEPSPIIFQLVQFLITSGKELASVAEIFVGKMPGQNTPATTTMASIDQGMKVFTAIYKRIYRALGEEFQKLFDLNHYYLDPQTEAAVLDDKTVSPSDFDNSQFDIYPGADPSAVSSQDKMAKFQQLMQLMPSGVLDPIKVVSYGMEAMEIPNWQQFIHQDAGQPKPDPKAQELEMKAQSDQQGFQQKQQQLQFESQLKAQDQQTQLAMKAANNQQEAQHAQVMNAIEAQSNLHMNQAKIQGELIKNQSLAIQSHLKAQATKATMNSKPTGGGKK